MDDAGFKSRTERRGGPINEMEEPSQKSPLNGQVALQKSIGYFSCVGMLVGTIIGSGIFVSPEGVMRGSGSVGLTLVIWLLCGIISMMGALAFAELGTLLPGAGGPYIYLLESFAPDRKSKKQFWGPLIPFLYNWQFNFFSKPAGCAAQGMACAGYIVKLSSIGCSLTELQPNSLTQIRLIACVILFGITVINCYSVKLSTRIVNLLTIFKLLALVFIIIGGIVKLFQGSNEALMTGFEDSILNFDGLSLAFYSGLWSYAGWDNLGMFAREMINPQRDILRSSVTAGILIAVLYIFVNISYFAVLSKEEFLASTAVSVDFASKIAGNAGSVFMVISVALSILGSSMGLAFITSRLCYAAAREGHMYDFFSYLHIHYLTPTSAILFNFLISISMIFQSDILGLISVAGFLDWMFIGLTMVSLLIMRKTKSNVVRPYTVPTFIPILVIIFSLFLVVTPFLEEPKKEYFYAIGCLFLGVVFYVPFVYLNKKTPIVDDVRAVLQKILLLAPPEDKIF